MYDLIIIGGGPAGASAGVYAARKRLKTVLVAKEWGGQSTVSDNVQNWIGTTAISGNQLAENLRKHVESYAGDSLSIVSPDTAVALKQDKDKVTVTLASGKQYEASAVLITAGATRRKLEIPGAEEYDQKGLTYCASCDGPLFADKDVAVIGGGNAAFETASQLLAYCKTVTLVNRGDAFRADEITVRAVLAHPNMRVIKNAVPTAIVGEKFVTGLKYKLAGKDAEENLPVEGIFVEIGLLPNTSWLAGSSLVLNKIGQIEVDPRTQRANTLGVESRIWSAGDCTNGKYHQNNIAAGDAVKALEDIYLFIKSS
ncbi:MAG: FAD-dependent oxidoreductase [Candidatus Kaiserbacteria bacterium]|nr:FAD-dependent oxidoreductase [Candidatus Kaiserbacteria bacterium]